MSAKRMAKIVAFHGKILGKGFVRMLCGMFTAGMLAAAGYAFAAIPSEGGYIAVCEFIAAVAATVVAASCIYIMGGNSHKNGM